MDPRNTTMHRNGNMNKMIYVGLAAGAAIGVAVALTRRGKPRRKERWEAAKHITRRFGDQSQDLAARGRDIIDRLQNIYEEGRKVYGEALDLWGEGRRLVRA